MDTHTWKLYYDGLKNQVEEAKEELDRAQGTFDALVSQLCFADRAAEKAAKLVADAIANKRQVTAQDKIIHGRQV